MPEELKARPYQEEAISAVREANGRGVQRPLISLPTGTGKTVIFSHLIGRRRGRSLVLAHRDELIRQAKEKMLVVNPELEVGVVKAQENDADAPVVIGSVQTLARKGRREDLLGGGGRFGTIVVDEAHHAAADSYKEILSDLGSMSADGPLTLGVTATPERADHKSLGAVWEEIVYARTIQEMVKEGYLCNLRAKQIRLDVDLNALRTRAGDFVDKDIEAMLEIANAPHHILEAWTNHAAGRKTLIFAPTVLATHRIYGAFAESGVAASYVDGSMDLEERRERIGAFRDGDVRVMVNCMVLTEGYDEPSIECIVVARPTQSRPLYMQMIGRGTRRALQKHDCLIVDCVGATTRYDLITLGSLFGIDDLELSKKSLKEILEDEEREEDRAHDRAHDDGLTMLDGNIASVSVDPYHGLMFNWLKIAGGGFGLSVGNGRFVIVRPEIPEGPLGVQDISWSVEEVGTGVPVVWPLATGLSLEYAQGVAEDRAREVGAGGLVNAKARWRKDPATPKQRKMLTVLGIPWEAGITKGEASNLIAMKQVEQARS